ncbi:AMP-binding protein [Geodermatophilus sp. SYSU D01062]
MLLRGLPLPAAGGHRQRLGTARHRRPRGVDDQQLLLHTHRAHRHILGAGRRRRRAGTGHPVRARSPHDRTQGLEEAIRRIGSVLGQLDGQSEAPMMISTMAPAEHPDGSPAQERFASAGRPTPLTTVTVMADDGRLLPAGERGEVVVRGSLVMDGYHRDPQATAEASRFGWHHTGDVGYLDADGWLYLVDRAKDMIISGGFNVYSAEVEQAVLAHPAVQDCAVVGVPDEKWGEPVVAVVPPRAGEALDPADVRAFVRARIGGVKAPEDVLVWADLPRSEVGKVLKGDVRSQLPTAGDA